MLAEVTLSEIVLSEVEVKGLFRSGAEVSLKV